MSIEAKPGELYTVRRKLFVVAGASFTVLGDDDRPVAYCRQKAFRLREDIRLYSDAERENELLRLATTQVIDFGATYNVMTPEGGKLASLRRKGMASTFVRDTWLVFDADDNEIAMIQEKNAALAMVRRYIEIASVFLPQTYDVVRRADGETIARFRQHFNPLVFRLGVSILADDDRLDDLVLLGAVSLIAAIEGRQG